MTDERCVVATETAHQTGHKAGVTSDAPRPMKELGIHTFIVSAPIMVRLMAQRLARQCPYRLPLHL